MFFSFSLLFWGPSKLHTPPQQTSTTGKMDESVVPIVFRVVLNDDIKVALVLDYGIISVSNPLIDEEKRTIYKGIGKYRKYYTVEGERHELPTKQLTVAYIDVVKAGIENTANNTKILSILNNTQYASVDKLSTAQWIELITPRKLGLSCNSGTDEGNPYAGDLVDMMQTSKIDNDYNYHLAQYIGAPELAKISVFGHLPTQKEISDKATIFNPIIEKFLSFSRVSQIKRLLLSLGGIIEPTPDPPIPQLDHFNFAKVYYWSSYIKRILFENEESRLLKLRKAGKEGYSTQDDIDYLVIDLEKSEERKKWRALLSEYALANPSKKRGSDINSTAVLDSRPYDHMLLDKSTIGFVAYDTQKKRMIGYVICSLRSLIWLDDDTLKWIKNPELRQLAETINRERTNDCHYDALVIEGLHVDKTFLGKTLSNGVTLSKMLVFTALEFVRLSRGDLGLRLVTSASYAVATKQILTSTFGFVHRHRRNDAVWLSNYFDDYKRVLDSLITEEVVEGVTTPTKLLFLETLQKMVLQYREKYYPDNTVDSNASKKVDKIVAMMELLINKFGNQQAKGKSSRIITPLEDQFDEVRREVTALKGEERKNWIPEGSDDSEDNIKENDTDEVKYMKSMRLFIDNRDDEDTFLLLDNDPEKFLSRMKLFPLDRIERVISRATGEKEKSLLNNKILPGSERRIIPKRVVLPSTIYNPTERDMLLYFEVLQLREAVVVAIPEEVEEEEHEVMDQEIVTETEPDNPPSNDNTTIEIMEIIEENNHVKNMRTQLEKAEEEFKNLVIALAHKQREITEYRNTLEHLLRNEAPEKNEDKEEIIDREISSPPSEDTSIPEIIPEPVKIVAVIDNKREETRLLKLKFQQLQNDYHDNYGSIGAILIENYEKKYKERDRNERDPTLIAIKDLDKRLALIGKDKWILTFAEWKKRGMEQRTISLKFVIQKLKESFPLLLDYDDLENNSIPEYPDL